MLVGLTCSGERERRQIVELRRIADQTPLYPGFQKVGEKLVVKPGKVSLSINYKSNAQFSDIELFYDHMLADKGWGSGKQPPSSIFVGKQNYVTYRRGDYLIGIAKDNSQRDTFDIVFEWDP
jgi:hypothetical protein